MRVLRTIGKYFWRFMVIFSFIVNIILVLVLVGLLLFIFPIKNEIAQPLITGLHSSFVGLDEATIDWTIPVRDTVPVNLDIPLETDTTVVLTDSVPLTVSANITAPGLTVSNATVVLSLPQGLVLPVALDLDVAVRDELPVSLDVRAVIPLEETQLHDVANNLRLLFEPFARGLHNLPNEWGEVPSFAQEVLNGEVNLLNDNDYSTNPWPGYSLTAGLNYPLAGEAVPLENIPLETGIVNQGGIPGLDEQLRPEVYDAGGPEEVNAQAVQTLESFGVSNIFFAPQSEPVATIGGNANATGTDETGTSGGASTVNPPQQDTQTQETQPQGVQPTPMTGNVPPASTEDQGIVPTPNTGG